MDTDRLADLLRGVRTTPSRRHVGTALVALAASSALCPLFDYAAAGGKGGGGKGGGKGKGKSKGKGKDKKKKKWNIDELPPLPLPCPQGQSRCGDATTGNRFCYSPAEETCCSKSANGNVAACPKGTYCAEVDGGHYCCPSGSLECHGTCCPQGTFCCPAGCCDNSACDAGIVAERCTAPIPSQIPRTQ